MSDKLALSAALSVLLMTGYALFGNDTARPAFTPAGLAPRVQVSARLLPAFPLVFAEAGTRHLLY